MNRDNNVTLSVVVLSYNNEQYIYDCLSSIAKQGIDSYEVLVIDDSSTDNSVEVINDFIKDHPQFELIQKPNSGGAISSQIGIARAKGKYLALVDSDDIVADNAYKKLIKRIEEDGSDFASGLPMKMVNGFMHTFLNSNNERNVFVENRVLSTPQELESYTNQVFYWNAVYNTEFLRTNKIEMPANLLIADRIFVYKAAMRAKKISVINDVVYYWRKKENSDKISITDQTAEFHMIADRCDSFQSQIKLCIQEFKNNIKYNKAIWEHSFVRLYYPLYDIANPENEAKDYKDFKEACERYRNFLLQYKAFFVHLVANSDVPVNSKFITERILTKHYKQLYNFIADEMRFEDLDPQTLDINVYNTLLRNRQLISVKNIVEEEGRRYINFQFLVGTEDREEFNIEEVFVYNRYFRQDKFILEYDDVKRRVDITDLPDGTYVIHVICNLRGKKQYYTPAVREELAKVNTYKFGEKIITYNTHSAILTLQKKNRFTVLYQGNDEYLLGVNYPEDIKEIFFFNVKENIRIPVKKQGDFYKISISELPEGDNVMIYKNSDGMYTTVRKIEFSNSSVDKEIMDRIIIRGKIEIEIEPEGKNSVEADE
ncbi:MAG: glycosyltransferase [Lachnospiraceae bacterium]|nr:glycosyltransferase [Lachnospiraceae bacterium]